MDNSVRVAAGQAGDLLSTLGGLFFTRRGRLSRGRFWLVTSCAWAAFWVLYVLLDGVGPIDLTRLPAAVLLVALFCLCSRRYHDLDRSSLRLLWLLVPLFGVLLVFVELGFRRGTVGENSFGIDPRELRQHTRDYATVT